MGSALYCLYFLSTNGTSIISTLLTPSFSGLIIRGPLADDAGLSEERGQCFELVLLGRDGVVVHFREDGTLHQHCQRNLEMEESI